MEMVGLFRSLSLHRLPIKIFLSRIGYHYFRILSFKPWASPSDEQINNPDRDYFTHYPHIHSKSIIKFYWNKYLIPP